MSGDYPNVTFISCNMDDGELAGEMAEEKF